MSFSNGAWKRSRVFYWQLPALFRVEYSCRNKNVVNFLAFLRWRRRIVNQCVVRYESSWRCSEDVWWDPATSSVLVVLQLFCVTHYAILHNWFRYQFSLSELQPQVQMIATKTNHFHWWGYCCANSWLVVASWLRPPTLAPCCTKSS